MREVPTVAISFFLLLSVITALACAPEPVASGLPTAVPGKGTAAAWEEEWQRTLAAARNEGTVSLYAAVAPEWQQVFNEAMSKKYGIRLEVVGGRSGEGVARLIKEQESRVYYADVVYHGGSAFDIAKSAGILESLEKVIILPEVTDPKVWWRGEVPWGDPEKTQFNDRDYVAPPMAINTDLVRVGDVKSLRDLLDPKWRGRIVMNNPTTGGSGQNTMVMLGFKVMDWDFVNSLLKQELVIITDVRLMTEWVARGRYPILIGPRKEIVVNFMEAGAPINFFIPSEGTFLTTGAGISYLKNRPHPNATKIFINFWLSKEGQTLSSKVSGYQSARIDVPTDYLPPILVRQPGRKYVSTNDKDYKEQEEKLRQRVTELFRPLLK